MKKKRTYIWRILIRFIIYVVATDSCFTLIIGLYSKTIAQSDKNQTIAVGMLVFAALHTILIKTEWIAWYLTNKIIRKYAYEELLNKVFLVICGLGIVATATLLQASNYVVKNWYAENMISANTYLSLSNRAIIAAWLFLQPIICFCTLKITETKKAEGDCNNL